jgi:hypothetical protein
MKHWTLAELKSAKIKIKIEYNMGKVKISSKNLILRPIQMSNEDFELLFAILQEYGKER